jgi:hypothetical protein
MGVEVSVTPRPRFTPGKGTGYGLQAEARIKIPLLQSEIKPRSSLVNHCTGIRSPYIAQTVSNF